MCLPFPIAVFALLPKMLDAYKNQKLRVKSRLANHRGYRYKMLEDHNDGCRVISPYPASILELKNHINKMKQGDTKIWGHPLQWHMFEVIRKAGRLIKKILLTDSNLGS